jgi:hypothetical protein
VGRAGGREKNSLGWLEEQTIKAYCTVKDDGGECQPFDGESLQVYHDNAIQQQVLVV